MVFDPIDLAAAPLVAFVGECWRHLGPRYDPLSGEGARMNGGRFNPRGSFPVLYLCQTRPCAIAELQRLGARESLTVDDLLPRHLYRIDVELDRVLDLVDASVRAQVGVGDEVLKGPDWTVCNQLGVSAHALGVQAIRSPSAAGQDDILAVFVQNIGTGRVEPHLVETWWTSSDVTGQPD